MFNDLNPPLLEVLSGFTPSPLTGEAIHNATVLSAVINSRARSMNLTLSIPGGIEEAALLTLKEELLRHYALAEVSLELGQDAQPQTPCESGTQNTDANAEPDTETGGERSAEEPEAWCGVEDLPQPEEAPAFAQALEEDIAAQGAPEPVSILEAETGPDAKENLFDRTERMRREEFRKLSSEGKKTKAFRSICLYGSSFKTKTVPLSQLGPDTGWVAVEGEVFSVNNREFKNRGAAVVSFEMTDYTSSVKVSKYMEQSEAAPLIAAIKPGTCLRVRGRMTMNKYDNDLVLDPAAIVTAQKEGRAPKPPGRRVLSSICTRRCPQWTP